MNLRLPKCASLCLFSAFLVTAGCSDSNPTGPGGASPAAAKFSAEPDAIVPEFISSVPCALRFRPFGGRVALVFHSEQDFVLRALHFEFVDVFGGRVAPLVSSAAAPSASASFGSPGPTPTPMPNTGPVPLPSSSTIPFPAPVSGAVRTPGGLTRSAVVFDSLIVPAGTRTLPLFLQFGCGVLASGVLFIDIDIGGGGDAARLEVSVGR